MALYFTSDLHFNHAGIINFDKRPFENVEEMNRCLVRNWNARITEKEEVYEYRKIHLNKQSIILFHYFTPTYDGQHRGGVMLYGHSHNTPVAAVEEKVKQMYLENNVPCKAYNVGCMYFGYTPATLEEIVAYWKKNY